METKEEFRDVKGFKGLYQISNLGRVKSIKRNLILKQSKDKYGYLKVGLHKNKKIKTARIHVLVAESFLNFDSGNDFRLIADHLNNDKSDNNLFNIQIATIRENSSKDRNSKSARTGVYQRKEGIFEVSIRIGDKRMRSTHKNITEASNKYLSLKYEVEKEQTSEIRKIKNLTK